MPDAIFGIEIPGGSVQGRMTIKTAVAENVLARLNEAYAGSHVNEGIGVLADHGGGLTMPGKLPGHGTQGAGLRLG